MQDKVDEENQRYAEAMAQVEAIAKEKQDALIVKTEFEVDNRELKTQIDALNEKLVEKDELLDLQR